MGGCMDSREYIAAFDGVRDDFEESVLEFGLPFEKEETEPRALRSRIAAKCACHCENGEASIWRNWISPACVACRTGERTATFFVSLKCSRHCYFCFNPNQENYEYWLSNRRDIARELRSAHAGGAQFDCLAITGGEPLLFKRDVYAFLDASRELYPKAHVRLYTCGDFLDDECLRELRDRGLSEIRFSVKLDGEESLAAEHARTLDAIERAVAFIPDVMVEMPVGPRDALAMRELIVRLDAMGVRGINLLEFGFPLCNADAFAERGFELRRNPYPILYNYWYAGGLPIAGSEAACLELIEFASERGLRLGVHYCSLDNKNTGQIYQQNKGFLADAQFARSHAWLDFDQEDYFLKCAKAVGDDALALRQWVQARAEVSALAECSDQRDGLVRLGDEDGLRAKTACGRCDDGSGLVLVSYDVESGVLSFPRSWMTAAKEAFPNVSFVESLNVVELDGSGAPTLREVDARIV